MEKITLRLDWGNTMSFTDQKPRYATEEECNASWNHRKNGARFRCYLCGHRFVVGDYWRWVYMGDVGRGFTNFLTCEKCDGPNVQQDFIQLSTEYSYLIKEGKYWSFQS